MKAKHFKTFKNGTPYRLVEAVSEPITQYIMVCRHYTIYVSYYMGELSCLSSGKYDALNLRAPEEITNRFHDTEYSSIEEISKEEFLQVVKNAAAYKLALLQNNLGL